MRTYEGKTVLVTGASTGIGAAMARQLAERGAHLLLTARSEPKLDALATELRQQGIEAHVFPLDLAQAGAAHTLFTEVTEAGHQPDVLVNNAAFGQTGRFDHYDAALYEEMIRLNVMNLVTLTRLFMPSLLAKAEAGVLNVASTAAFQPVPLFAVYAATKAFVLSFSTALAEEYRETSLAVTCLCPGSTETEFHERANSAPLRRIRSESAEKVARVGLEALLRQDALEVSGWMNKVQTTAIRFVPRAIVLKMGHQLFQRIARASR